MLSTLTLLPLLVYDFKVNIISAIFLVLGRLKLTLYCLILCFVTPINSNMLTWQRDVLAVEVAVGKSGDAEHFSSCPTTNSTINLMKE